MTIESSKGARCNPPARRLHSLHPGACPRDPRVTCSKPRSPPTRASSDMLLATASRTCSLAHSSAMSLPSPRSRAHGTSTCSRRARAHACRRALHSMQAAFHGQAHGERARARSAHAEAFSAGSVKGVALSHLWVRHYDGHQLAAEGVAKHKRLQHHRAPARHSARNGKKRAPLL